MNPLWGLFLTIWHLLLRHIKIPSTWNKWMVGTFCIYVCTIYLYFVYVFIHKGCKKTNGDFRFSFTFIIFYIFTWLSLINFSCLLLIHNSSNIENTHKTKSLCLYLNMSHLEQLTKSLLFSFMFYLIHWLMFLVWGTLEISTKD